MTKKDRPIYWTVTKQHPEGGVVVFGPVALPVTVLVAFFCIAQVLWAIASGFAYSHWGLGMAGWISMAIFWGIAMAVTIVYLLWVFFRWMYETIRDANSWKVEK